MKFHSGRDEAPDLSDIFRLCSSRPPDLQTQSGSGTPPDPVITHAGSRRSPDLRSKSGSSRPSDLRSKKSRYDEGYHFITIVTNKRVEVFKYKETALIAINTILFYEKRGDFNLKGYIIMPDHIHMICEFLGDSKSSDLRSPSGSARSPDLPITHAGSARSPDLPITHAGSGRSPDLPTIIRDIKKYIAKETIQVLKSLDKRMLIALKLMRPKKRRHTYQLWQPDYYDFNILTERKLNEKLKYMFENPLRKGLCDHLFDYEYSDVKRYFGSGDPKLPSFKNCNTLSSLKSGV